MLSAPIKFSAQETEVDRLSQKPAAQSLWIAVSCPTPEPPVL
jgi:hypothetical protein